ncbi:hydrogenase, partial [Escherichia coli]|nr:hydrogenase [Escherichia coli]
IVPIDVWIPGCPPTPAATIYGFAVALGLLDQKLKGQNHTEVDNEQASLLLPSIPLDTRVMIEREARRLAGYYQGRQISDHFLTLLDGATVQEVSGRVDEWLRQANDPRLAEIVKRLVHSLNQGGVHV